MNRPTVAAVALSLIVGGMGASHALGDLLGMFSRGLGASGWIIFALGGLRLCHRPPRPARRSTGNHRRASQRNRMSARLREARLARRRRFRPVLKRKQRKALRLAL